jgi:hypothetical protein
MEPATLIYAVDMTPFIPTILQLVTATRKDQPFDIQIREIYSMLPQTDRGLESHNARRAGYRARRY